MNYYLLFGTAIVSILPVLFIKQYIKNNLKIFFIIAYIAYLFKTLGYYEMLKTSGEISSLVTLVLILKLILVFFIGVFLMGEKLNKNKIIGISLGILAIYFLSILR
jgi:drug/metabolite transporter (DMT)-like permease